MSITISGRVTKVFGEMEKGGIKSSAELQEALEKVVVMDSDRSELEEAEGK